MNKRWYVVGAPWLPSNMLPYITAGNEDPHVGIPVVDMMDADEWIDHYSDDVEVPDVGEICQHIVDLHNGWLDAKRSPSTGSSE